MKKHIYIASLLALGATFAACDDVLEPAPENTQSFEQFHGAPASAHGVLLTSYAKLGFPNLPESDLATDDAVSNELGNNWTKIATGAWSPENNPLNRWQDYYYAIQNLNIFIEQLDKIHWYEDPAWQDLQIDHFLGEAYGLRAILQYYLLQAHAGKVGGQITGVLIHTASENGATDFNQSRSSYKDSYQAILNDFDEAIKRLPDQYLERGAWTMSNIPQRLLDMGATVRAMERINGAEFCTGKLDGRICKAFRAKAALMAASPAYGQESWDNAAKYAQEVVNAMGGVNKITKRSIDWFSDKTYVDGILNNSVPEFAIWWVGLDNNNSWESDNFPPSMNGKGRTNPTQNLVDAFPMANGYPISESASGYDKDNPYAGRDPRLEKYILFNDGVINKTTITTADYATTKDGIDLEPSLSTRTGYYMKKLLAPTANPSSTNSNKEKHVTLRVRALELFLVYAEAANEAWGPTAGSPSAYDVIKQIRSVAGIAAGDAYLESIKGDQAKMRDLIRNERRINLCFENKRFWDLRRWNLDLTEPARGMKISGTAANKTYTEFEVDARKYQPYMIYGPLPIQDVNKFSNLQQNDGWK